MISPEAKSKLGQILARLLPGGDFQVFAFRNHEIVWKDARPQPSDDAINAEYFVIIAEEAAQKAKEDERGNTRRSLAPLPPTATLAQVINKINDIIKVVV